VLTRSVETRNANYLEENHIILLKQESASKRFWRISIQRLYLMSLTIQSFSSLEVAFVRSYKSLRWTSKKPTEKLSWFETHKGVSIKNLYDA
jgi:hypothetical protein